MIKYYFANQVEKLKEIDAPQKDCWIHLESPSAAEVEQVRNLANLEQDIFRSALDEEEVAHMTVEDNNTRVIFIDIPKKKSGKISTIPLAFIQTEDYLISVCTSTTSVLRDFFNSKIRNINTARRSKLTYQIIYNAIARYLYYLRQIDKSTGSLQKDLAKSLKNKEVFELLELQKTIVFFSSSLTANNAIIQKIAYQSSKMPEDERDIVEDLVIENKQAIEMCAVYREIMKSSMDAFGSVINNNQNTIMKLLTAVTIILAIPTLIASMWGMNTGVPFEGRLWGFWVVTGVSLVITSIVGIIMAKKRMF